MSDQSSPDFAVIFDVDGVLVDSEKLMGEVVSDLLARRGVDFNKLIDPSGQNHVGGSADQMIRLIKNQFGVVIDKQEFTKERAVEVRKVLSDKPPESNLIRLLEDLKERGVKMAVATSGEALTTATKLDLLGVEQFFEAIITSQDVTNHKPHPDPYLAAAEKLGVPNIDCVAIEDSVLGTRAGRAAGMKVIAFLKHSQLSPDEVEADLIVHDWDDVNYQTLEKLVKQSG